MAERFEAHRLRSAGINKLHECTYLKTLETSNNPCVSCSPARIHRLQAPQCSKPSLPKDAIQQTSK